MFKCPSAVLVTFGLASSLHNGTGCGCGSPTQWGCGSPRHPDPEPEPKLIIQFIGIKIIISNPKLFYIFNFHSGISIFGIKKIKMKKM